jgi:hypothetical protein
MGENQGKPKIAVIAVHGVADQPPHNSARAIASLLLNHNQSEKQVQYTPFYESTLRMGVRPVDVSQKSPRLERSPQQNSRATPIHNYPESPDSQSSHEEYLTKIEDCLDMNAHEFIWKQLHKYKGMGVQSTYETVRLEGSRLGQGNEPQPDVHIYEMYWADLSRLGTGIFRILGEFYQLLFHLSSLGVHAVDSAYQEHPNTWWNWYKNTQAGAADVLSMLIPILNLYLLLTVPITLPGNIPAQYLPIITWSSLAIISVTLVGLCLFWLKASFRLWSVPPILLVVGVIGLVVSLKKESSIPWPTLGYYPILAFEWCALAAIIMWLLMREYSRHSPLAGKVSTVIGVFLAGIITKLLLYAPNSHQGIAEAAFKTVEIIYLILGSAWIVFFVLQLFAALLGCVAVWQSTGTQPDGCRERANRAAWTARLTLAVPATLFIVVTLMLLGALDRVGSRLLPKENFYIPRFVGVFLPNQSEAPFSGPVFTHQLIIAAASPAFVVVIACILLTVVIAFWSLFPVAWAEVRSPKSTDYSSEQFGKWLTNGLDLIDFWANVFVVFIAVCFPLFYLYCLLNPQMAANFKLTEDILGISATFLVASTTSLLAFRGRLDKLLLGFRSLLDVVLDVDNYLRLRPEDDNPSARIYSRYVSVLRYLCNWEDPQNGQGYDAIVIVAHSQGTAITADLLRFLERETKRKTDPALTRLVSGDLPIYFFTMGCPLRQLYGLGFPHLYNWARHYDKTPWTRKPHKPLSIDEKQKPNPRELLGVTRWVNTFRSGDYIGRYLWRSDYCDYQWFPPAARDPDKDDTTWTSERDHPVHISEDKNHTRREFCLGAGAHTHYWDGTSDEVAAEIDILIREACCETLKKRT